MSAPDPAAHWRQVYGTKAVDAVSWYEPVPERSLELIRETATSPEAPIIDVGGGASTLVDHLLADGRTDVTVMDIAPAALQAARARLGEQASRVTWLTSDVLSFVPGRRYAVWHDRAVLHFLTRKEDRERYVAALRASVEPGGNVVLATFGPDGPTSCSGLPVRRYSAEALSALLGEEFALKRSLLQEHRTPGGKSQQFVYGRWSAQERVRQAG